MANHPNRSRKTKIGARVEAGAGADYDTGTVMDGALAERPAPGPDMVWVAWDSGTRTWTPHDLLRLSK